MPMELAWLGGLDRFSVVMVVRDQGVLHARPHPAGTVVVVMAVPVAIGMIMRVAMSIATFVGMVVVPTEGVVLGGVLGLSHP